MSVRELALLMLDQCELEGKYVNLLLNTSRARNLPPDERSQLTALLYTVTERRYTYDYYISAVAKRNVAEIDMHTLNLLRLGVCQVVSMDSIPDFAAVNETVKLARNKGERAFVNAVLRKISSLKRDGELPMPDRKKSEARYLSVLHSFPLWLTRHFITLLGERETDELLCAFNTHDRLDITVNTLKTTREKLIFDLSKAGVSASPSDYSPITVRIDGSCGPRRLPGFSEGLFFVQDEASAISVLALMPEVGDKLIDVCACPGGKSFAASILKNGEVTAFDLHESKLSLVSDGAVRLGLSVKAEAQDALSPRSELFGTADKVICDCPCSGLGVLGKKPDMRYRPEDGLAELPALQYSILEASARYLKVGGYMIYSTCTLNPLENERVVERFVREHPEFRLVDFELGELKSSCGMLTLWPHIHKTDGFFIAKLTRVA